MQTARILPLVAIMAAATPIDASWAEQGRYPPGCLPRQEIVEFLEKQYGETLQGAGKQEPNTIMELYVSEGGSWTVLVTRPDGFSCPMAIGDNWRQRRERPAVVASGEI